MLSYRSYSLAPDFLLGRCDGSDQLLKVGIEKHCAVYYAGFRLKEIRISRDLLAIDKDVVPSGSFSIETCLPQRLGEALQNSLECRGDISGRGYE